MVGQPELLPPFAHAIDDAVGGPIGSEWVKTAGDFFVEHPVGEKFGVIGGDEAGGFAIHGMGEQGFGGIIKVDFTDVTQATDDGQAIEIRNVAQEWDALEIDQAVKRYQGAYQTCMRLRGNKGI